MSMVMVFDHIYKCAGTSVSGALRESFPHFHQVNSVLSLDALFPAPALLQGMGFDEVWVYPMLNLFSAEKFLIRVPITGGAEDAGRA